MSRQNQQRARRVDELALIIFFLAALSLPVLGMALHLERSPVHRENRTLAPFPALSLNRHVLGSFPEKFREYFEDHFGFRQTLIGWQARVKVTWLGVSSSRQVLLGKEGWLFQPPYDNSTETYRGPRPFTEQQLAQWQRILETRRAWLAQRGIPYLFVVAPEKGSIYPEYMPDAMTPKKLRPETRLDQLLAYMKLHSTVEILDLRPSLSEAKSRHRLYHKTDTHWNDYGAFVAYRRIMRELSKFRPGLEPAEESDFEISREPSPGLDLAALLGLDDVISEEYIRMRSRPLGIESPGYSGNTRPRLVSERSDAGLPRLVMFRDSFANNLIPFLDRHFSRIVYIWNDGFDPQLIETEHPDFVIQEIVERALLSEPVQDPMVMLPVD
ncbi:MAG TPA: hypothetical protein VF553_22405 [Pyrinomonadaceae bacterium]|jgi:hypothetical protein